jgi:hypothetical protein
VDRGRPSAAADGAGIGAGTHPPLTSMDVFLVPLGAGRSELYCETSAELQDEEADALNSGWIRRQIVRFKLTLAEAEEERRRRDRGEPSEKTGLWRKLIGKIAEAVAEQRLLWHLRYETRVQLIQADDLDGARAVEIARAHFTTDYAKHRRWVFIDGLLAAIIGPGLFFVPGPNFIAYYFVFRAVGHYFSMRGARHGLEAVTWEPRPSTHLTEVARVLTLPTDDRRARLDQIAHALGLEHFAAFAERVANH